MADQKQTVCVRRETGMCRICWSADSATDVGLGLDTDKDSAKVKGSLCCAFGSKGTAIDNGGAYDCLMIPGAKTTKSTTKPASMCGRDVGLVSKSATKTSTAAGAKKTICCKLKIFKRISTNIFIFY